MKSFLSKRKVRIGLVGCGLAAQFFHAPAYRRLDDIASVVAIADPNADSRALVKMVLPSHIVEYDSYEEMAQQTSVDMFDVMLPHHLYVDAVKYLAPYHTALMLEKPFALSLHEGEVIVAATEKNFFSVMHNYLYGRRYRKVLGAIRSGTIGRPVLVRLENLNTGMETIDPSLQTPWREKSALAGGGTFHDHGYHLVYLARALMGSEVATVSAAMGSYGGHGDTLDTAVVTLRHKNGGTSVLMDGKLRGNTVAVEEVFGTEGMLTIPYHPAPLQHFQWLLRNKLRSTALEDSPYASSTAACLREFIEAFRVGGSAPTSPTEALQNLRVTLAAQQSHEQGKVIYV